MKLFDTKNGIPELSAFDAGRMDRLAGFSHFNYPENYNDSAIIEWQKGWEFEQSNPTSIDIDDLYNDVDGDIY
jgi:hypothetical protein